jgi:Ser/Thr protein kinase RdoA (MazF antagonist)
MLQWKGTIYELFEYIKGTSYDNSLEATGDAGKILALFHKLLKDYQPEYEPPQGSYHAARSMAASMKTIPDTLARFDPASDESQQQRIARVMKFLYTSYNDAARRVNDIGLPNWPGQIVHCDWHPGNMLFRGSRVVAVIDYDAARIQQRIIDAANGALQFSILGGGDDPSQWPEYIDESRFKRFIRGYDSVPDAVLSRAELRTIPWLMIEALIAESVIPIAATGSFARLEGVGFLLMVERKVRWLQERADALVASVDE